MDVGGGKAAWPAYLLVHSGTGSYSASQGTSAAIISLGAARGPPHTRWTGCPPGPDHIGRPGIGDEHRSGQKEGSAQGVSAHYQKKKLFSRPWRVGKSLIFVKGKI